MTKELIKLECWVNPFKTHTYIHLCHVPPFHWFLPSPFPSRSLVGERVHWRYFGWCCRRDGQRCYLCTMYIDALFFSILPSLSSLPISSHFFHHPSLSLSPSSHLFPCPIHLPLHHVSLSPLSPLSPPLHHLSFLLPCTPNHHLLGLFPELHLT